MKPTDMKGKAALVTGAASGLGRGVALALARAGADLFLVDVNAAGLEEIAAQTKVLGVRTQAHATDLSKAENCKAAVAEATKAFGRLDALCNVAGIIFFANAHEMPTAEWDKTLAVNLSAPFYLSQAAIPHLLEANGAIVNITSSGGFVGEAYLAAYCATKAGLAHLTKALAMEYINKPIRINAVAPGGMMTNIGANLKLPADMDYTLMQRYSGLRGMVEVDDVAELVAFLCSDAARGYHGAILSIDKGITAG
jgi:NAD(P)-dependent dehydrogenase (short-subunit alcohol dehydrogenase family)